MMRHTKLLILILSVSFVAACAHKPTASDSTSTTASAPETPSPEDKAIQQLPKGSGSDLNAGQTLEVPVEVNQQVEKWIEYFQGRGREHMERYLQRSSRYMPLMKKVLSQNGMPEELVYLALIESGFSSKIRSRAGAVGFWQFMPGTGKHYGLKKTRWIDERCDPVRSTEAAATYLKGLYNLFGNWYLAIASYNVGENRIKNLVMRYYTRDFWELARKKALPAETQQYIPKFIAAGLIAREPEKYGFVGIEYHEEMKFENFKITKPVDLKKFAQAMGVSLEELHLMNPQFRTNMAPASESEPVTVRIPEGKSKEAQTALESAVVKDKRFMASAIDEKPQGFKRHRVRKGETLESIAEKYEVTEEDLAKYNRLRQGAKLRSGTRLKIPNFKSSGRAANSDRKEPMASARKVKPVITQVHVVKHGETLAGIARKYNVSVTQLAKKNRLTSRSNIQRGQRLAVPN